MKKMRAIENIRIEETLYKPGEEFEIAEEETQRLIDLGAAEFVSSEILIRPFLQILLKKLTCQE